MATLKVTKRVQAPLITNSMRFSLQWINFKRKNSQNSSFSCLSRKFEEAGKPYYITTPIFYVNDSPHIGHLYSMVYADILKRWQVLKGKQAILCTGTDEHGMKVLRAAENASKTPKDYCDLMSGTFKMLASRANISSDHFIRTTDSSHKDAVQHFWTVLKEKNFIYESDHQGWYCVSDETFYPETAIEKRIDPFTGRDFMASKETGKEVEYVKERNYHFRLSEFKEPLLKFYKENPDFVVPSQRMKDIVAAVSSGLEDLSVSRPADRASWGIRVPHDDSQTIYVWFDALINYITSVKYPWPPGQQSIGGWPADLHVIGKDILRFHCIYWPAFVLAAGLKPPKQILSHSHWTMRKQKMSKSIGNVVNPFFAIDRFGVDAIRYYLVYDGAMLNDSDYGNQAVVTRYKKGLQGGLGNLLFRITRPIIWNPYRCVLGFAQRGSCADSFPETKDLRDTLLTLSDEVNHHFDQLEIGKALQSIMTAVFKANTYFHNTQPWMLTKYFITFKDLENRSDSLKPLEESIYNCMETLRICGILLQPFIPNKATELLDYICVDPKKRSFDFARYGADFNFGNREPTLPSQQLFPRLPVEN
ncbi:putative methionine--tRNA ligase, mitochondrial [Erysiphe necator]|uniref:Probable methionine--tRNA ligase, mitochondrial n=1 Tax=Uncinula necator TaxID=52586 RepID=A0A0B1P2X8_UNCNE|nr:putative methionine--tRNA ligase, mitochondrial [Erysiphe necator]KHJ31261.1 putative methionyl-trna synthetase [Erysiphe necator]